MSMSSVREQLVRKLQSKEYRDAFTAEQIFSHLPLKIRSLRESRHLSQKQLGEKAGVAQAWVSKLEDPNYGKLTLSTLLRLASAFDVGLEVDFVPFSRVLDRALKLSPESFEVRSFAEDVGAERRRNDLVKFGVRAPRIIQGRTCTPRLPWLAGSAGPSKIPWISPRQEWFYNTVKCPGTLAGRRLS